MIYRIIRPIARLAFKAHFRKIFVSGIENIPSDKPVILAVNHPTAFVEPCLLACFQPNTLNFLVRGDIWKNSFYNKLMRGVHLIPIYRQKDGYENLTKNYETFKYCNLALKDKKTIVVLPEGTTIQGKRLRPIKKGFARIVAGALEAYPDLDIKILPVGANYTYANRKRSEVMIKIGHPISVQDFFKDQAPNRAILQLTNTLKEKMEAQLVNIPKHEDEPLVESILPLVRSQFPDKVLPVRELSDHRFQIESTVAKTVCNLSENEKTELRALVEKYQDTLDAYKVEDTELPVKGKSTIFNTVNLLLKIPSLLGYLANIIPIGLANYITRKQVHQREFIISVFLGIGIFSWLFFWLAGSGLLFLAGPWWSLGFFIGLPLLGFTHLVERSMERQAAPIRKMKKLSQNKQDELAGLKTKILKKSGLLLSL
jgi:1-acyl-sn-glycerol-3-phosphate acyltransferase